MAHRKVVGVLGLGSFGQSLCRSLKRGEVDVIAVDRHESNVELLKDVVDSAITGDSTDPAVLQAAGVGECDVAIVAIGENTESSVITTLNVEDLGVPAIYARAVTSMHRRILRKLGVTQVINPEEESAVRLAAALSEQGVEQLVELGEGFSFVILGAPEELIGKTLQELDLRRQYRINVVGLRRNMEGSAEGGIDFSYTRFVLPEGSTRIEDEDRLLVIGRPEDIRKLTEGQRSSS